MDLGMLQRELAEQLGVSQGTLENWEQGLNGPEYRHYPAVIGFLRYDPNPTPKTLGEQIAAARRRDGLTQRELAQKLGVDPTTVQAWEAGRLTKPYPRLTRLFRDYAEAG
jgi:transcriptional regulator with XRE-family HTH domain